MPILNTVLENYLALCAYCDTFFNGVYKKYSNHMQCKNGCSSCCELSSVCALEAHIIISSCGTIAQVPKQHNEQCVLLHESSCTIYNSRPIICRTHGLLMIDENKTPCSSCPLNFTQQNIADVPVSHILDAGKIADNLMRLNLAFCMEINDKKLASKRFLLSDVRMGNVPEHIFG